jgi:polysaccharide transporter, PST family
MAVSMVRAKYLAVNIGPEGYGEYAMIASFFTILTALCGGWIARGTIKYTAEYKFKNDLASVSKVHNYSFSIALILGSTATLLVLLFQDFVREKFLSPEIVLWHFSLFTASFLATSLTTFFSWLLQGFMMVKKTVALRIYNALFNILSIFVLVYFFELTGYFLSILVSAFFGLFIYWRSTKGIVTTKFLWPDFKDEILQKIMRFGGVNFFLLVLNNICEYIQRIFVLTSLNIASVGLFQIAVSIMGYMGIANRGSLFVNDSKMAQDLDNNERNIALNNFLRFNILFGMPISLGLILFSKELITILYSKNFVPLSEILFAFVIAQFFGFLTGGFQSIMLGRSFLKMHSFISVTYSVLTVLIPFIFISEYGLVIIGISMVIANLITLIVDYIYLNIKIGIKIFFNVWIIFVIGVTCFAISYIFQSSVIEIRIGLFIGCIILLLLNISKTERIQILNLIGRKKS